MSSNYRVEVLAIEKKSACFALYDLPFDGGIPVSKFFALNTIVEAWRRLFMGYVSPPQTRKMPSIFVCFDKDSSPYQKMAEETPLGEELSILYDLYWGMPVDLSPEQFAEVEQTREYKGHPIVKLDRQNHQIEFQDFDTIRVAAEQVIVSVEARNFNSYDFLNTESLEAGNTAPNLELIVEVSDSRLLEFLAVGMYWETVIYDDQSRRWYNNHDGTWSLR